MTDNSKYAPRPLFADGSPVEIGDYVNGLDGPVVYIQISFGKLGEYWYNILDDYSEIEGAGPFERKNVILDLNHEEIHTGDTVWNVNNRHKYTVFQLPKNADDDVLLIDEETGLSFEFNASVLTHQEPDSLTNLQREMSGYDADDDVTMFAKRLAAIMERDGLI